MRCRVDDEYSARKANTNPVGAVAVTGAPNVGRCWRPSPVNGRRVQVRARRQLEVSRAGANGSPEGPKVRTAGWNETVVSIRGPV